MEEPSIIEKSKFSWTEKEYREHIESVVESIGYYTGEQHYLIAKDSCYSIQSCDNKYTCKFDTLDSALETFIIIEPFEDYTNVST